MRGRIADLVERHEKYRSECINLIPSENVMSETARKILASDLVHRYHHEDFYGGLQYILEILQKTRDIIKDLFKAKYAFIEPLSGNISFLAALLALSKPGDKIAILSPEDGGYPFNFELVDRVPVYLPFDWRKGTINIEKTRKLIYLEKPSIVVLGSSFILFPFPVKAVSEMCKDIDSYLVYDGSHVLGLIAGNTFQDPLAEGADVLLGSTHKTFPGPQGGLILTNNADIAKKLAKVVTFPPVLIDNAHVNRIAALGITAEELLSHGKIYAKKIIENSKFLAKELHERGVKIAFENRDFTESHQIWLKVDERKGKIIQEDLERANIIVDRGVRFGTQEVTRKGITKADLEKLAEIISSIIVTKTKPTYFLEEVKTLARKYRRVLYSFDVRI